MKFTQQPSYFPRRLKIAYLSHHLLKEKTVTPIDFVVSADSLVREPLTQDA
jgi:hypothetical protein